MKFFATILSVFMLLFALSAEAQSRGRYVDQNGMPYGGHNPPVFVGPGAGGHCMYSVYGCSGAGGSTNFHGYRPGYVPGYPVYGGPGYRPGYGCGGNNVSRWGNVGYYNGRVTGNIGFSRSTSGNNGCNGNWNSAHQSGNIGYYNGQVQGNIGFSQSQSN